MNVRKLIEASCPVPVEEPKTKPKIPGREAPAVPSKKPNPFRRKDLNPKTTPKPKANYGPAVEGRAEALVSRLLN